MSHLSARARRLWIIVPLAVLVLASLLLATWALVGRRPQPLDPAVQLVREQVAAADRWAAVTEADVSLATVRADLTTERGNEGLDRRVDYVTDQLGFALAGSDAANGTAWSDLEAALEQLEQQLRTDDPGATETLAALNDALRDIGP